MLTQYVCPSLTACFADVLNIQDDGRASVPCMSTYPGGGPGVLIPRVFLCFLGNDVPDSVNIVDVLVRAL